MFVPLYGLARQGSEAILAYAGGPWNPWSNDLADTACSDEGTLMARDASELYRWSAQQVVDHLGKDLLEQILIANVCDLYCDLCPLRPWKSSLSRAHCSDVLARASATPRAP
jgi:hypothetical protein